MTPNKRKRAFGLPKPNSKPKIRIRSPHHRETQPHRFHQPRNDCLLPQGEMEMDRLGQMLAEGRDPHVVGKSGETS